jgi:cupin superfamily acireductone dioxygenase involved in methionine salvage
MSRKFISMFATKDSNGKYIVKTKGKFYLVDATDGFDAICQVMDLLQVF